MWEDGEADLTSTDLRSNPEYYFRSQTSSCGICGGQSSTGNWFFFRVILFPPFGVIA